MKTLSKAQCKAVTEAWQAFPFEGGKAIAKLVGIAGTTALSYWPFERDARYSFRTSQAVHAHRILSGKSLTQMRALTGMGDTVLSFACKLLEDGEFHGKLLRRPGTSRLAATYQPRFRSDARLGRKAQGDTSPPVTKTPAKGPRDTFVVPDNPECVRDEKQPPVTGRAISDPIEVISRIWNEGKEELPPYEDLKHEIEILKLKLKYEMEIQEITRQLLVQAQARATAADGR
jgi:hypothetical protein